MWRSADLTLGAVYVHEKRHDYARSLGFSPLRFRDFRPDDEDDELLIIFSRMEFPALPRGVAVAFVEHGAGASYEGVSHLLSVSHGYAPPVAAVLTTPAQEAVHRRAFGDRVHVIGCPKLDAWHGYKHKRSKPPVVAFSHHWEQRQYPETRSAWPWDATAWERLIASGEYRVLGHKHPGDRRDIEGWCRHHGIEFVPSFDEVMRLADVYVADNSSTLYEFAATGRPVVCLSPPWYRRHINHGVRFWEHVPGVECAIAEHLEACIAEALVDVPARRAMRQRAVEAVYGPLDGGAASRAVEVIQSLAANQEALSGLPRAVPHQRPVRATFRAPIYRRANTVEVYL